ncbi:MAG: hypothetical protein N4A54_03160 [Peptostreptococcaceae bacterium]|jgi:hypothetical protein|nr:hypothetical protein [Peptostreptococcaceae bacterium]
MKNMINDSYEIITTKYSYENLNLKDLKNNNIKIINVYEIDGNKVDLDILYKEISFFSKYIILDYKEIKQKDLLDLKEFAKENNLKLIIKEKHDLKLAV